MNLKKKVMLIVTSKWMDIYRNLAAEEYLLEHVAEHDPILFLWQSPSAVVVGKNQNPWLECRLKRMKDEGVPLARRVSGGGAVYHDAGNLNYCIIVDRLRYCETAAFELVAEVLKSYGIQTERSGQSNLAVQGKKFSGNAFCFRKKRAMHHGTLLVESDLARLGRYLGPTFAAIETHAIRSVPAKVCNLTSVNPQITVDSLATSLMDGFQRCYRHEEVVWQDESFFAKDLMTSLVDRQCSDEWKYGSTPSFSLSSIKNRVEVVRGYVKFAAGENTEQLMGSPFWITYFSL